MPTSKFSFVPKAYTPKKNDFICLPFLDGKTQYFSKTHTPDKLFDAAAPEKKGSTRTIMVGELSGQRVVAKSYRLDAQNSDKLRELKKMVASALNQAEKLECKRVVVIMDGDRVDCCKAVQEGALLGGYAFDKYLKKKKTPLPVSLFVKTTSAAALRKALNAGNELAECINFARDTLNEPPNAIDPVTLCDAYKEFGTAAGLKVTVWNEARLKKEKCGGILAVGAGSSMKSRLVIGEYIPKTRGNVPHLVLVGKGVTFDTGGYCLKPGDGQQDMKMDMGGAAMMFSAACAIARLKLPVRVTVYTPLAENDISSTAYHTSDIITMRSGTTVQVDNTDAEGRLILADTLTIACQKKPDYLIDSATLTGACVVALGEDIAAVFGTDRAFNQRLIDAGLNAGEDLWEMPLHMPYMSQLKTKMADCKNLGNRWGGSISAALFLKKFVSDDVKNWIHVDIAGPGCKQKPLEHLGLGAKGFGVKTIVSLAQTL